MEEPALHRPRRPGWWKPILKWTIFAVVLAFIGQRAVVMWREAPPTDVKLHYGWLLLAGLLYLVAWLPSVWFWKVMLEGLGHPVPWRDAIRAYYIGHLGKYVPGKAMVLVLRASLLRPAGCPPGLAALTATYETLVMMAAGAMIAVALAPFAAGDSFWSKTPAWLHFVRDWGWVSSLAVILLTVATTPFSSALFTRIGRAMSARSQTDFAPGIPTRMVVCGLAVISLGWLVQGASLGCVIQGVSAEPVALSDFPLWLLATSLATFGGFVILVAPGGLGVREFLLAELLLSQPGMHAGTALLVAGLARLVGFVAELVVAAGLYWFRTSNDAGGVSKGSE